VPVVSWLEERVLLPLVGASCAKTVSTGLVSLDLGLLLKHHCFSLLLSKVLGLGIVAGEWFRRVAAASAALERPQFCPYPISSTQLNHIQYFPPGSAIVKVPQILKIRAAKSTAGISYAAGVLETMAILTGLAYSFRNGYAFSTYGDGALVSIQNILILALIHRYAGATWKVPVMVGLFAALTHALFTPSIVAAAVLAKLQV
jgi:uncharacterized protein with PQ loop repeat